MGRSKLLLIAAFSKILGLVRQLLLIHLFGATPMGDTVQILLRFPSIVKKLLSSGDLPVVWTSHLRSPKRTLLAITLFASLWFLILIWVVTPFINVFLLFVYNLMLLFGSYFGARLFLKKRYALVAFFSLFPNLAFFLVAPFYTPYNESLIFLTLAAGSIVQCICLLVLSRRFYDAVGVAHDRLSVQSYVLPYLALAMMLVFPFFNFLLWLALRRFPGSVTYVSLSDLIIFAPESLVLIPLVINKLSAAVQGSAGTSITQKLFYEALFSFGFVFLFCLVSPQIFSILLKGRERAPRFEHYFTALLPLLPMHLYYVIFQKVLYAKKRYAIISLSFLLLSVPILGAKVFHFSSLQLIVVNDIAFGLLIFAWALYLFFSLKIARFLSWRYIWEGVKVLFVFAVVYLICVKLLPRHSFNAVKTIILETAVYLTLSLVLLIGVSSYFRAVLWSFLDFKGDSENDF